MTTDTLLILKRDDLNKFCINDKFDDINLFSFSEEINKLAKEAGIVVFKDVDLQTKIITSKYGFIENLKISKWKIFQIN